MRQPALKLTTRTDKPIRCKSRACCILPTDSWPYKFDYLVMTDIRPWIFILLISSSVTNGISLSGVVPVIVLPPVLHGLNKIRVYNDRGPTVPVFFFSTFTSITALVNLLTKTISKNLETYSNSVEPNILSSCFQASLQLHQTQPWRQCSPHNPLALFRLQSVILEMLVRYYVFSAHYFYAFADSM